MSLFSKANPSCLLFLISSLFLTSLITGSFFRACKLDKVFKKNIYIYKTPPVCRMGVHRDALPLSSVVGILQPDPPPPEISWLPGPVDPFPPFLSRGSRPVCTLPFLPFLALASVPSPSLDFIFLPLRG